MARGARDHAAAALDVDATKAQLVDDFQQFFAQLQRRAGLAEEAGPGDKLDDQEAFDKLEMERVAAQDPDALAFFRAQKTRRATATSASPTNATIESESSKSARPRRT